MSPVTFCNDEEDCVLADAAILTVVLVGVGLCTTLHPTAAKISAIAIRMYVNDREQCLHKIPECKDPPRNWFWPNCAWLSNLTKCRCSGSVSNYLEDWRKHTCAFHLLRALIHPAQLLKSKVKNAKVQRGDPSTYKHPTHHLCLVAGTKPHKKRTKKFLPR